MKVKFKSQFFGPDGSRYRPDVEHEVPDSWRDKLPSGATIVEEKVVGGGVKATAAPAKTAAVGAKI